MRYLIALACVALLAAAAGCGQVGVSLGADRRLRVAARERSTTTTTTQRRLIRTIRIRRLPRRRPAPRAAAGRAGCDATSTALPPAGTPVTITGSGFVPGTTVMFGAVAATAVTVVDAATITAIDAGLGEWLGGCRGGRSRAAARLTLPGGFTYADETAPDATATITITPAGNTSEGGGDCRRVRACGS